MTSDNSTPPSSTPPGSNPEYIPPVGSATSTPPPLTTPPSPKVDAKPSVWEIYFPKKGIVHREAVYIASFPEIIYFWPVVAVSFFCAFLQGAVGMNPISVGWLWCVVVGLNSLVLVQDFDQKQFVIVILAILALFLGIWIVNLYGFSFFQSFASWLLGFQPLLSTDALIMVAVTGGIFLAWGLISPLFSYWRFEQNEFVHFTQPIGRDMSVSRLGCTVMKEIPDILECILTFGGGTLVIKKDSHVVATIPNIPFLGSRMETIEHLLSETRVTVSSEQRV